MVRQGTRTINLWIAGPLLYHLILINHLTIQFSGADGIRTDFL